MKRIIVAIVILFIASEASAVNPCTYGGETLRPCPKPMFIVNPQEAVAPTVIVEPAVPEVVYEITVPPAEVAVTVEPAICEGSGITDTRWQFAGITEAMMLGSAGSYRYTRACQAEFGDGAKVCTTAQVLASKSLPSISGPAWVLPSLLEGHSNVMIDASGISEYNPSDNRFSCPGNFGQFYSPDVSGLVIEANLFRQYPCDRAGYEAAVVCCDMR